MNKTTTLCIALLSLFAAACGDSKPAEPAPAPEAPAAPEPEKAAEPEAKPEAPAPAAALEPDAEGVLRLTGNDAMQFNTKAIKVKAGAKVKLELKHVGTMPKAAMGHNFVLLAAGSDAQAFAMKAAGAAATEYVPEELKAQVLAATTVVGGGETATIEFDAPAAGTYSFLCSFPGHFALMQGEFVVE